jgi:transcriptional regulator with XRE-family HTH domain
VDVAISTTLDEGLRRYEIGEKLRALRLRKKMGLVELSKHTGLSPALLSKVERSKLYPPLPTLLRIALVFGVGLDYFFADETRKPVVEIVRKKERVRFPDRPESEPASYFFESLDFKANERKLSAYLADFQRAREEDVVPHAHPGVELLFVIEGSLRITIGRQSHDLDDGDAIYFDASVPHGYRRTSRTKCTAVVVTV